MAVEVLIRAEATPSCPRGAILAVKPGGFQWSDTEKNSGRFLMLRITDATVEQVEAYTEPLLNAITFDVVAANKYSLNAAAANAITPGTVFVTTFATFQAAVDVLT